VADHIKSRQDSGGSGALAALCLQPFDAEAAVAAREQGMPVWPWTAWAGRQDSSWWWKEALLASGPEVQEADARRAVALRPYFAPGWYWLGLKLAQDGGAQRGEADQDMAQALSLEPNFCRVLAWQADEAIAKGDKAGAQRLIQRVWSARALTSGSPDEYTAYIQSADPDWLGSHRIFTR
jgi:hypothetical protein